MHDSRLEERIKSFKASSTSNICKRREEYSLSLRKDKLFNILMEKRINPQNKQNLKYLEIDLSSLSIPQTMLDKFHNSPDEQKLDYIIKWILEEDTQNSLQGITTDIKKFSLHNLKLITEDLNLDDTTQDINLDKNLVDVLLYDLFQSRELIVKYEISEIFLNLSSNSKIFTESLLDVDYLNNFLEMTYSNYFPLVENILLIIGNIFQDHPNQIELFASKVAIVYRLKELLQLDKFDGHENVRNYLLWLIKTFVTNISKDKFLIFLDFIPSFIRYFQMDYIKNEENLNYLLQIISFLSLDDKYLIDKLLSHNITQHILELLDRKNLVRDYLLLSIRILGNLMCRSDMVVDYLIEKKVLEKFEKLLNTYRNSVNNQDNLVLSEVIWALSNITAGTENQIEIVIFSNLPKIILNLNKSKKNNKILSESIHMFYAALRKGNKKIFAQLVNLDVIRLFCDAVNNSETVDLIESGLNAIQLLIEWSKTEYNSSAQIKSDLICFNTISRIERLINHKNEKISKKATCILEAIDMISNDENKMDFDGIY